MVTYPDVDPATYASPNGRFELHIDPSDWTGTGPADYRLSRDGVIIRHCTLPFTLVQAELTDEGYSGGYAYTQGHGGCGDFIIAIFDCEGNTVIEDRSMQEPSNWHDYSPNPHANGLIMDGANDRMIVRIADPNVNRSEETWLEYRLSTGRLVGEYSPQHRMPQKVNSRMVISKAELLRGTGYIVVHWMAGWISHPEGRGYSIFDIEGHPLSPADAAKLLSNR